MDIVKGLFMKRVPSLLVLALILIAPATGYPATFIVNSTADVAGLNANCVSGTGQCTLRSAVQAANASISVADTITLPAGTYTLTLPGANENAAATGDLDITGLGGALTITGAGAATTIIDGGAIDGVFETIFAGGVGANATISGVTIRNGNSNIGQGGGIHVGGGTTLVLNSSVVTACTSLGGNPGGGGIDITGTVTMNTVAVTNNNSLGGAVNTGVDGALTWTNGTVSGNFGGGINNGGTMGLTNVTVSDNTTPENGAGIDNDGTLTLQNVTISGNTSTTAVAAIGGIRNRAPGLATVTNTIISGNSPANCGGTIASGGNNIDNGNTCGFIAGDSNTDPLLTALANNGGFLLTHALPTGSPAIDTGSALNCPAVDARGIARPVDGDSNGTLICDKGAYEFRPQKIAVTPATINFGSATNGTINNQTVTLSNTGDGGLIIGSIAGTDPLAAPFSVPIDGCSGQTLARTGSCTLTARFAPTTAALSSDTFDIPSNDPLAASVTFAVSGTGTAAPVPIISVTDSVAPNNDLQIPLGNVSIGNSADATVTVSNTGTANLAIGAVTPLSAPFSITADTCSNKTLAPNGVCTLTVRFTPTANAASTGTFNIPNNDLDTPSIILTLTGSGISATGGNPPSAPILSSPANGLTGAGATMTFTWEKSVDPDGDAVTYHFYNCTSQDFTGCAASDVTAGASKLAYAGMGSFGAGIIVFGFVMGGGLKRSRKTVLGVAAIALSGMILVSCSGGSSSSAPPTTTPGSSNQISHTVTGLAPSTTYFWKVVADDGKGGLSSSETRSFTTQ